MKRFQARRGSGQWTRNTPENTLGMHIDVCAACNALVPWPVGEAAPDACHHCGAVIIREKCAHGRCRDRFPDPFVFQRGGYAECGKPAVACEIGTRWGQCDEHLDDEAATGTRPEGEGR